MSQFVLKIKLGNEAMQTRGDIANALKDTAECVQCDILQSGKIMDLNGNLVGSWSVK